jgi:hypothetical protein
VATTTDERAPEREPWAPFEMVPDEAGMANLARYVDPAFVSRLGIWVREADADRLPERYGPVEGARRAVAQLYQQFAERHLHYASHAFRIGATDPASGSGRPTTSTTSPATASTWRPSSPRSAWPTASRRSS